jgi:hypothetical protein
MYNCIYFSSIKHNFLKLVRSFGASNNYNIEFVCMMKKTSMVRDRLDPDPQYLEHSYRLQTNDWRTKSSSQPHVVIHSYYLRSLE